MLKFTMGKHRRAEERPWVDEVHDLARRSVENPMVRAILDSIEGLVMILDAERRVLAANPELLESLELQESESLIGKLPGDAMGCIHAGETPLGCGSAPACTQCGTLFAIVTSQERNGPAPAECCLNIRRGERLESCEFQVRATPLVLGAHRLTILVLQDISARKRREVLESLFFHDVRDAVQGITAWSEALGMAESDPQGVAQRILALSMRLNEQVAWKHRLFQAEAGTLGLNLGELSVAAGLGRLRVQFEETELLRGRTLRIEGPPESVCIRTDQDLLLQILGDMVTNALEATAEGGVVRVRWEAGNGTGRFTVHNPGAMAEEVALRVFQRTFTTKPEPGRGLGTYSMKILGENLLGGRVSFRSSAKEGTTFILELPDEAQP
jgi:hypothetical protein